MPLLRLCVGRVATYDASRGVAPHSVIPYRLLESIRYGATSKSFVAAEDPFTSTSSLYFPAGHPSGFET